MGFGEKCPYIDAFGEPCGASPQMGDKYCHEHLGLECAVCKSQATHACTEPGPMGGPCGFPLCDKHRCQANHNDKWHK